MSIQADTLLDWRIIPFITTLPSKHIPVISSCSISSTLITPHSSPLNFISDPGRPINANGFEPSSSPYVVWSSCGGPNGTIVVSDADHSGVFINTMLGDPSGWRYKVTDSRPSYSRALAVWRNQPRKLAIISAASFDDAETNKSRPLTLDVMDLETLIAANPPPEGPTPIQIYYPKLQRAV